MNERIRISVVIACHRQSRELELVLTTFLEQSLDPSAYELLVVDDHSPDTSAREVVARTRARFPKAQLYYLRNWRGDGGHYGASAQVKNVGIRAARGDIVFFNNAEIAQAGESLSYILEVMDGSAQPLCLRGVVLDLPAEEVAGRTPAGREALHDAVPRERERVATADHAGLAAVHRHLLLRVGGIDERFDYWGKEDLDLAARLKRAGVLYRYDPALKSFHLSHPKNHIKEGDYRRMCALLDQNNQEGRIEVNQGRAWGALGRAPQLLHATVAIEVGEDGRREALAETLEEVLYGPDAERRECVLVCDEARRGGLERWLESRWPHVPVVAYDRQDTATLMRRLLRHVHAGRLAWMPEGMRFCPLDVAPAAPPGTFTPWLVATHAPDKSARPHPAPICGWIAHRDAIDLDADWGPPSTWVMRAFGNTRSPGTPAAAWAAVSVCLPDAPPPAAAQGAPPLTSRSSVLVAIPHHRCEQWLTECLRSILEQTRPPEAIAVLHDGPDPAPLHLVEQFPSVSLYRSDERVGPYALVQSLVDRSRFDAVLFQDADDWSSRERLAVLLSEAERTGAELVGSQEIRVDEIAGRVHAVCYPRDVNQALAMGPGHPLLHPTSLISTRLLSRLGGFATALRFGADTEMLLRAGFVARIVNVPVGAYFRRHRQSSLTTAPETGLDSPARQALLNEVKTRARQNQALHAQGQPPELQPLARRAPVPLLHLAGPSLLV